MLREGRGRELEVINKTRKTVGEGGSDKLLLPTVCFCSSIYIYIYIFLCRMQIYSIEIIEIIQYYIISLRVAELLTPMIQISYSILCSPQNPSTTRTTQPENGLVVMCATLT